MGNWFCHCRSAEEARLEYRRLCMEHHPDRGGDTLVMQAINEAYRRWKGEYDRVRPATPRSAWQRPARERPRDVAPERSSSAPEPPRPPRHSRDAIRRVWNAANWEPLPNGNFQRTIFDHTVLLLRHPAPKYQGAWFVMIDNVFSPYFYDNRPDAEQTAFDLLYDKVKYRDLE